MDILLRDYRAADAPSVVALINAEARETLGTPRAVVDTVGQVRLMRYVPSHSPKVVAVNVHGDIVGFAYLANREKYIVYEIGGAVHPTVWGAGIGTQLLQWGEQRVSALSQYAPAGVKTVLQMNIFEAEPRAQRLLARAGYAHVREWAHFHMELAMPPPVPEIPAGMLLRPIDLDTDWDMLGPAMDEAFADHWGVLTAPLPEAPAISPAPITESPEDDSYSNAPGFCFMLMVKEEVVGGILCNTKLVERAETGRVGSMFVRPAYRRQGLGRVLMHAALHAFWQAGLRHVILDTDAQSFTHAPKFYAHFGMHVYRREFLYEKEMRPGIEVRRLTI